MYNDQAHKKMSRRKKSNERGSDDFMVEIR